MKRNRDDEDDEDDDFVTIGTPLPLYDEDEVPLRKPVALQDQSVRDAQGRVRFHGAFTGGFSAGYFNTVDTKEGWTPQTFKSSRSQKAEASLRQKPEDFMDDEDFSEFGIAPKKVATTKNFTDLDNDRKRKAVASSQQSDDSLFGSSLLTELVMPCRSSMGVRLLRKLGWRDSQGIGPRERRRKKRPSHAGKLKLRDSSPSAEPTDEGQRTYSCALPPGLRTTTGGRGESDGRSADDDDDDDDVPDGITFAPHDVCPISFVAKDNVHGLGYRGIDPTAALFHGNRLEPIPVKAKGRLGIRGQAFGVGAFEDEDDDIYGVESMTKYDIAIGIDDQMEEGATFGWTAPKNATGKRSFEDTVKNKDALDGFIRGSSSVQPKTNYPPPQLPRDFRPFHKFESTATPAVKESVARSTDSAKMNAFSRGDLLGERPHLRSVFELVSTEDRAKMEAARMQLDLNSSSQQQQQQQPTALCDVPRKEPTPSTSTNLVGTTSSKDAEAEKRRVVDEPKRSGGFVPFARDPAKQKRYEAYLDASKHSRPYVHDDTTGCHMTEWEMEREKEEFMKAAHLYQPLSNMIASRFTRAKHDDNDTDVQLLGEKEKSAQAKAAEMKMFGKLTRQTCAWHPDKMVCRRFNIADPYPESKIVGLRTTKRDKPSIFNFLEFPSNADGDDRGEEADDKMEAELKAVKEADAKPMKPLAILATVDLRPKVGNNSGPDIVRESSATLATSSETNVDTDRRPPIDLFKAIFEDTDSDESSSSESPPSPLPPPPLPPQRTEVEEIPSDDPVVPTGFAKPLEETPETVATQSTVSVKVEIETVTLPSSDETSPSLRATVSEVAMLMPKLPDEYGVFGPALPPPAVNKSVVQKATDRRSTSESNKVRSRHKSKHKHKTTHKSTSKKRKHKKNKKQKKLTKATSSQSRGSDADYESDSDSTTSDIDRRIMSKLKGYIEKGKDKGSTAKRKK